MYIFTPKNVFAVGLIFELIGIILFILGWLTRCADSGNAIYTPIPKILSVLRNVINSSNIVQISYSMIVLTFLLAMYGKKIEINTFNNGLFSIRNAFIVVAVVVAILISCLKYKVVLTYKLLGIATDKQIPDDRLLLSMGFVLLSSGIIAQVFGC